MKCTEAAIEAAATARALARDAAQLPSAGTKAVLGRTLRSLDSLLSREIGAPDLKTAAQQLNGPVQVWLQTGNPGELSSPRMLRKLCYLLDDSDLVSPTLISSGNARGLLALLESNWRDTYLSPLIMVFLDKFEEPALDRYFIKALADLLQNRLSAYKGERIVPKMARSFSWLIFAKWDPAGLARQMAEQGVDWFDACEEEGVTTQVQATAFFGCCLIEFARISVTPTSFLREETFDRINRIGSQDIPKALLAVLIGRLKTVSEHIPALVKYSFQVFGDPTTTVNWRCAEGAYRIYDKEVEEARKNVAGWVNRQVLEYFFAKAAINDGRKAFWSRYVPRMDMIRIAMTGYTFERKFDAKLELSTWIRNRLVKVEADTTDIGLIMEYGDWAIVEIGTHGNACYFYERKNPIIAELGAKIAALVLLKNTSLPFLSEDDYRGEGRFRHGDGWQHSLNFIMKNKLRLQV